MALNLPVSRNTTYAPGTDVESADLNDIQDKIIDENSRAIRPRNITPASGFIEVGVTAATIDGFEGAVGSQTSAESFWYVPIDLAEGDVLDSVDVRCIEANAGGEEIVMQLFEDVLGAIQQIADTITTGTTGGAVTHTWDDTTNDAAGEIPYTVPTNGRLILSITFGQTSALEEAKVLNVRVSSH